jgi:hypothetical protein
VDSIERGKNKTPIVNTILKPVVIPEGLIILLATDKYKPIIENNNVINQKIK